MFARTLKKSAVALPVMLAVALGTSFAPTTTGQTVAPKAKAKVKAKVKAKAEAKPKTPLDLNTATAEELVEALPGVGEVTARKIVAGRPYASVDDLAKAGVPARTIEAIRPLVTLAPPPAPRAKAEARPKAKSTATAKGGTAAARLDLNTATAEELVEALPGVGEVTARKIVAGRPYASVDDLAKAGVPARTIDRLRDLVVVAAPPPAPAPAPSPSPAATKPATTRPAPPALKSATKPAARAKTSLVPGKLVNINTAPKELLDALPGIGPVKAQAIIDTRPFKTKEDVMKVKGIKEGEFARIKDLITVD